jgi:uncharacterized RDD family membrane protein YckC
MMHSSPLDTGYMARSGIAYAGFWRRVVAYLIDGVLISTVQLAVAFGVLLIAPSDLSQASIPGDLFVNTPYMRALLNVAPVCWALTWAYFAIFESSPAQATVGKMVLNLYVSDLQGDPISFGRASLRYWFKALSNLTLLMGWLMVAFTPRKQALHDMLAGTLVLRRVKFMVSANQIEQPGDYWDGRRWVSGASAVEEP